ncbi:MAG: hypothetical protein CVV24_14940 [Ignavibacteriae bacterium HGW-Ignavibacteriae-3]|nr:MAG: hypothetical protein CVV24_14940 [Ignavibacteriae bacterium HGW-Ignavibacteriae-3]
MKYYFFALALFTNLFFFISCKDNPTQTSPVENNPPAGLTASENELIIELNKFIKPLNGTLPSLDDSDLRVFDKFAEAKVIGLGEATHGTKDFFQMKHRLFKYFVEKHGFKIFGFEADMGECIYIDRFIASDIGTIDEVMRKMHFWTWRTQEVKELILWMNQYNKSKSPQDKIHLLGVDCQFKDFNKILIMEYLQRYDGSYPPRIGQILTEIDQLSNTHIQALTSAENILLKARCDSIKTYFDDNSSRLIASSGQFEFTIIRQLIRQTQQYIDVISSKTFNYRDQYMAENSEWLTDLLAPNTKVVLWAHNGHLAKDPAYLGSGSQGSFLSENLSTQYKVIGFSFNQGTFRAVGYIPPSTYTGLTVQGIYEIPPKDSFNFIFYFSQPKNFILINNDVTRNSPLYSWINSNKKILSIGAVYSSNYYDSFFYTYNLGRIFDAVIHINTTLAADPY